MYVKCWVDTDDSLQQAHSAQAVIVHRNGAINGPIINLQFSLESWNKVWNQISCRGACCMSFWIPVASSLFSQFFSIQFLGVLIFQAAILERDLTYA